MLTEAGLDRWLEMMGPLRLYVHPDGRQPVTVALPDGRETTEIPLDVECEPLDDDQGVRTYYLGWARNDGTPAAQFTLPMTMMDAGDTFTITREEVRSAL